jgi:flagellar hook-length control protein FliK
MPNPTTVNPSNRLSGLFSAGSSQSKRSSSRDDANEQSSFEQVLQTSKTEKTKRPDRNTRDNSTTSTKKSSRATKSRSPAVKSRNAPTESEESEIVALSQTREPNLADTESSEVSAEEVTEETQAVATEDADTDTDEVSLDDMNAAAAAAVTPAQVNDQSLASKLDDSHPVEESEQVEAVAVEATTAPKPKSGANVAIDAQNLKHADEPAPDDDASADVAAQLVTAATQSDTASTKTLKAATEVAKPDAGTASIMPLAHVAVQPTKQTDNDPNAEHQQENSAKIALDDLEDAFNAFADDPEMFDLDAAPDLAKKSVGAHGDANAASPAVEFQGPAAPVPNAHAPANVATTAAPETRFATDNHEKIVSSVRTNLLPNGGTMQIRLDPPELGDLQLSIQMRDGVMSASFQTSSDQATHLLSHSLGELRASLEASGISVDKIHVEQAPRDAHARNDNPDARHNQDQTQDSPARRDQQRRETLQRMWRRLSEGSDPLDLIA